MKYTSHKAFTMVELVFVIVILGVVASIGSTVIAQLYENYIIQRASHKVSLKTELAINQIVNRLSYRIGGSAIARNPTTNGTTLLNAVAPGVANQSDIVLEWIGYDNDSFASTLAPLWSGYCDTSVAVAGTAATSSLSSPGSNFNALMAIVNNLSPNPNPQLALVFALQGNSFNNMIDQTNANCYGFQNANCIHQVAILNNTTLRSDNMLPLGGTRIGPSYKLAWTAYALVPITRGGVQIAANSNTVDFDLELRYGYQPWAGQSYLNASRSTIARNVTAFKFLEQGGTLRIKLCMTEQIGGPGTPNVSMCKEKVVLR